MYQALKDSIFFFIPLLTWLLLSFVLFYLYSKDRNKRKLFFAIGVFVSAFGFFNNFIESLGITPIFPFSGWLFIPIALAVVVAALSSLFKVENFQKPFIIFLTGTVLSLLAYFVQFPFQTLQLALTILFMATSVPILIYIFLKSRSSPDLYFLFATLCFLFQGLVSDLGTSREIPVLLAIFGVVFIALMYNMPEKVNPSSLPSFIVLEKKLDEANQNLKLMEAKLIKAERLAAIGELAGIIGHDLRNPLQGIMGATHYLKTHAKRQDDSACIEMIIEIEDCILRADKIINDLIEYSQNITLVPVLTNPKTLTAQTLGQIKLPANIEINNKTTAQPELTVDDHKIQRAFNAILKNAFDAMPEGGTLTLESEDHLDFVVFRFQDRGVGMDMETQSKIWMPMFTTKAKGMGFGLPISKRFVEAHGGKISIQSSFGKGTTVTVLLPKKFSPAK
jgi:signal transduction histidine kinase